MSDQAVTIHTLPTPPAVLAENQKAFAAYMDVWRPGRTLPAHVVSAAQTAAAQFDAYLAPASRDHMRLWLLNLRKGTARIENDEFDHRFEAVVLASGDLPAWVWCKDALRDCLRSPACRFFPSAPDLDALLRPRAKAARHAAWLAQQAAKARIEPTAQDDAQALPGGLLSSLAAELKMPAGNVS